ncbi:ABC transporter substrate-binding protein [Microbacterium sp. NPDC076911]|uniref:ABC transporter substrate-binding protein n=1 Tax=Microbacterium sp. NPDC076911 TaxID=3154958 RepID=UPI00343378CB
MTHITQRRRSRAGIAGPALGLASVLVLAGCSSASEEPSDSGELGGTVTALITPGQNTGLEPIYEPFEEESGVAIDADFVDAVTLIEQLRIQLDSGTAPDLFRPSLGYGTVGAVPLGEQGYLADLTDEPWVDEMPASVRDVVSVDGKVYAYPASAQSIVMYYNKSVFDDLGLQAPNTWDEFIEVNETVKEAGLIPISLGLGTPAFIQFMPFMLAATLVSGVDPDIDAQMADGDASFAESVGWKETFEKFFGLIEDGYTTPTPLGMPSDQSMQAVATGEAAMIPLVSNNISELSEYFENGVDDIGVFALPATNNAEDTWVPFSPELLAINAEAENPAGAKAFLTYLSDPARSSEFAAATGTLPAFINSDPVDNEVAETLAPFIEESKVAPFVVHLWPNGEVQQVLIQSGQLVLTGDITIDELLEEMDAAYAIGRS